MKNPFYVKGTYDLDLDLQLTGSLLDLGEFELSVYGS
jgi:hypothetical protein